MPFKSARQRKFVMMKLKRFNPNIKSIRKQKYICECEDFPCCGHSKEDRYTTEKSLKERTKQELKRIEENNYGY